jgi:acyl-CoA reductase-like NAD-dependent aldehyde dehydrogenase
MSTASSRIAHSVGGERLSDSDSATDHIVNPWTGAVAYEVERGSADVIDGAIDAAFESFAANRRRPAHERAEWLRDAADAMMQAREDLTELLIETIGKPRKAASAEVARSAAVFRLAAEELTRLGGETLPLDALPGVDDVLSFTLRSPFGVAALITPFNAPLNLLSQKLAPAIAMGNAVVIKPSVEGAAVTARLIDAISDVFPVGLINVVSGNHEMVHRLVSSPRVTVVSLTGGIVAGKAVLASAGIKPVHLELGSNSPNIVLDDADLAAAATKISRAAFEASGQQCISAQRILVQETVVDEFLAALKAATLDLVVGDPSEASTDLGPVVHERAATRHRELIAAAEESGAQLVVDGRNIDPNHPLLLGPTLISGAGLDSAVMCEEAFGPIAVVEPVASLEDAIEIANSAGGLLQAACFTNDLSRSLRAVRDIEAGSVWINEATRTRYDIYPFGGTGESGLGREGIRYAMEGFSQLKHVGIKSGRS